MQLEVALRVNAAGHGAQTAVKYLVHHLKIHSMIRMQMEQRQKENGLVLQAAGKQLKLEAEKQEVLLNLLVAEGVWRILLLQVSS